MKLTNWLQKLTSAVLPVKEVEKVVNKIEFIESEVPVTKIEKINNDVIINHIEIVETEVPVTKIETVNNDVEVHSILLTVSEVPVTKIETITIEKPVFDEETPSKINELIQQLEKVMGLRDLFKSKTNEFESKYTVLLNTIDVMNNTIQQLTQTIESQQQLIVEINNTKIKTTKSNQTTVEKVIVENPINVELQEKVKQLNETRIQLESRLREMTSPSEIQNVKDAYYSLIQFCFENINPTLPFDPAHAKKYWEDLVK